MSFKASRNKATKCRQQQRETERKKERGKEGSTRVCSAIVQSADNGRATLWDSVLVSLSISFFCVCVISNFPFSTFF